MPANAKRSQARPSADGASIKIDTADKQKIALTLQSSPGKRTGRSKLTRILEHIVSTTPPSRLFELYYWAQEPGLLKLFRRLAILPAESRNVAESFFDLVAENSPIAVRRGAEGQLIIEAENIGDAAHMVSCLLDDGEPDPDGTKLN